MASIDLILSPNLRTSSMKTSRLLKEKGGGYDVFFMNVPFEMEEIIMGFATRQISYDELICEVRRHELIPEPEGSWEYTIKPILEVLPHVAQKFPNLTIYCYGTKEQEFASMKVAVRIALLILRTILIGEVESEKWRDVLMESREVDKESTKKESETILRKKGEKSLCVSGLEGRRLKHTLSRSGLFVKIHYVEKFYHFTPLMILKRKMVMGSIGDEELEELVWHHVEYVKSYTYRFRNRDRAHYEWVYEKIPWLRRRINKCEIKLLDSLINKP